MSLLGLAGASISSGTGTSGAGRRRAALTRAVGTWRLFVAKAAAAKTERCRTCNERSNDWGVLCKLADVAHTPVHVREQAGRRATDWQASMIYTHLH